MNSIKVMLVINCQLFEASISLLSPPPNSMEHPTINREQPPTPCTMHGRLNDWIRYNQSPTTIDHIHARCFNNWISRDEMCRRPNRQTPSSLVILGMGMRFARGGVLYRDENQSFSCLVTTRRPQNGNETDLPHGNGLLPDEGYCHRDDNKWVQFFDSLQQMVPSMDKCIQSNS